jgi:hypothetical protein
MRPARIASPTKDMPAMKLWPRFLCKRDAKTGAILEERQFDTPESVPPGEGWENISPPTETAAPAGNPAAFKALQKRLDDEETASTKLSQELAAKSAALAEAETKVTDLETMLSTADSRVAAAEKRADAAEAELAELKKTTAKPPKG